MASSTSTRLALGLFTLKLHPGTYVEWVQEPQIVATKVWYRASLITLHIWRTLCFPQTNSQDFLDEKLEQNAYLTFSFDTKATAYHNEPTQHQLSSYGSRMIQAVKGYEVANFRRMVNAGLSPNACNAHGESLCHMVCRRGNMDLFRILLDANVDLLQSDDYGRTVLHDCCWASSPSFEIARILVTTDPTLLCLRDARGALPLSYVSKSNWGGWNKFIEHVVDEIFPIDRQNKDDIPELCLRDPNSRPVANPKNMIPHSLANMVANGLMHPYEVMIAMSASGEDETTVNTDSDDSDYDSEEDEDSFDEDDDDDDDVSEVSEVQAIKDSLPEDYKGESDAESEYSDSSEGEFSSDEDNSSTIADEDVEDLLELVDIISRH